MLLSFFQFQSEIKQLQLELSKTKSQFVSIAGSVADSVVNQVNQVTNKDGSRKTPDLELGTQTTFNKKKSKKSEIVPRVQLLKYTRRGSVG